MHVILYKMFGEIHGEDFMRKDFVKFVPALDPYDDVMLLPEANVNLKLLASG